MNNLFNRLLSCLCIADILFLVSNLLVIPFHFGLKVLCKAMLQLLPSLSRRRTWASCSRSWRARATSPCPPPSSWSWPSPSRGGRPSASPSPTRSPANKYYFWPITSSNKSKKKSLFIIIAKQILFVESVLLQSNYYKHPGDRAKDKKLIFPNSYLTGTGWMNENLHSTI